MGIRNLLAFCILLALFFTTNARLTPFAADPPASTLQAQAEAHPPADVIKEQSLPEKVEEEGSPREIEKEKHHHHHHHPRDPSMAGGGVIIGGLATAIFAAVYCYIRVTRKTAIATAPSPVPTPALSPAHIPK